MIENSESAPNSGTVIPGESLPVSTTVDSTPTVDSGDIEIRARAQGWVPKEDFRGNPEQWRDADDFVRRGEEETPILRERNRDMARKIADLETRLNTETSGYQARIQKIERMSEAALQKQRESIESNYAHAMRQAVEIGDVSRYDQLNVDRVRAVQDYDQQLNERISPQGQRPPAQGQQMPAEAAATVDGWIRSNEWFNRDKELAAVAEAHHVRLLRDRPGMSLAENLSETTKYVRQRYSDKFGSPSQAGLGSMVESGSGRMAASSRQSKGVSHLSAVERSAGEKFVREGLFKDLGEYAKELFTDA